MRLADRMCRGVLAARAGRTPLDAHEAFAMAAVFARNGEPRAARECYEAAFHDGDVALRRRAATETVQLVFAADSRGAVDRYLRRRA